MPIISTNPPSDYRILVCRGNRRPSADLYPFNLPDVIPSFPLPLRAGDTEPIINLQALLNDVYNLYGYDLVVDYHQEPVPKLGEDGAVWSDVLLRGQGLR